MAAEQSTEREMLLMAAGQRQGSEPGASEIVLRLFLRHRAGPAQAAGRLLETAILSVLYAAPGRNGVFVRAAV